VQVDASELRLGDLQRYVERTFRHIADQKSVAFHVEVDPALPNTVFTDIKRLQQIIKNLLSNAFKFTHTGSVSLQIAPASGGWSSDADSLHGADQVIAYTVADTGIGIAPDKQHIIFEAFQQADGSTSRKYGGTGLGLAISRELSKLLGGEIRLASAPGAGSVFTLYLPKDYVARKQPQPRPGVQAPPQPSPHVPAIEPVPMEAEPAYPFVNEADDDRQAVKPGDEVILIVENDVGFAKVLLDAARQQGMKGVVAGTGAAALAMTKDFQPALMTLDIFLPDMHGWRVLDRMKEDLSTRHIPICVVSTDDARDRALNSGAAGFIAKPLTSRDLVDKAIEQLRKYVARGSRSALVLLPAGAARDEAVARLRAADVQVIQAGSADEALAALAADSIDCLVLHESEKRLTPQAVLEALEKRAVALQLPVVVFGSGTQAAAQAQRWKRGDGAFALREAQSVDRMLDHVYFFLHRNTATMSPDERQALEDLHSSNRVLERKKALIVDDDMRNIFALATVLDEQGMEVVSANNGRDAIKLVEQDASIDIALMDIMMPEMDGITTIQEIRKLPRGKELPIIAVTAKAMKGDRARCIEAGAWDYLSKPVDRVHLLAVLRGWLYR
jgi:CheY-like chemotaxis protein